MAATAPKEHVSARDAVFLMLEGRTTPYHMASLLIFEGPAPGPTELRAEIESRLGVMPRARQRIEMNPLTRRLAWVEDTDFDLGFHVHHVRVPGPGADEQLKSTVATLMEAHLDRYRPLWEMWLLDGLQGGRFGLLLKVHHAAVDGATGARDLEKIFGTEPAEPHHPAPRRWSLPSPGRIVSQTAQAAIGSISMIRSALAPAPRAPFNRRIGPNRTLEFVRSDLQDFVTIKNAFGVSVNDVVLAVTAQGLRAWYLADDRSPDEVTLRALVPVALRDPADPTAAGNSVTGLLVPLPIGQPDPVERLRAVHRSMRSGTVRAEAVANQLLLDLPTILPRTIAQAIIRIQEVQRFFNLSITNMRGPERPLFLAGRRAVEIIPIPPLSANAGLIVAVMSYAGTMRFGLMADPDAVRDLGVLAEGIEKEIAHLLNMAVDLD